MPRFFVRQDAVEEGRIRLCGEDAHHVARSLRMAVGDAVTVCDMQGNEYDCRIRSFDEDRQVFLEICSVQKPQNEPPCRITLFQALPKGDKLETVIQKSVECGVSAVVPFESEHCVVRMKPDTEARKTERRQRIAAEAAKQCGRSLLPPVSPTVSFAEMLEQAGQSEVTLFCYEGDGTEPLGAVLNRNKEQLSRGCTVSVIVGSEGGFSVREAEAIRAAGMTAVGLGKRILRAETAPVFVLSCLCYASELEG